MDSKDALFMAIGIIIGVISSFLVLSGIFWAKRPKYSKYTDFLKTQFSKLSRATYLILVLTTVVCIVFSLIAVSNENPLWSALFIGLSASLGASILTSLVTQYFLGEDRESPIKNLETIIRTGFQQLTKLNNTTLFDFHEAESYSDFSGVFTGTATIKMCFLSGKDEIFQNRNAIIQALKNDTIIHIILLHPEVVDAIESLPEHISSQILFGICSGKTLKERLSWSLLYLSQIVEDAGVKSKNLHIRFSKSIPMAHIVITSNANNEERHIFYVPYLQERGIIKSTLFEFLQGASSNNNPVEDSFENAWKTAAFDSNLGTIKELMAKFPTK
jgi:hypothetical protein